MANFRDENYTTFKQEEEDEAFLGEAFGNKLEGFLNDLQVEGAIVSLEFGPVGAIRLRFGFPPLGVTEETEVDTVMDAAWWFFDLGVRYYREFAQDYALWCGGDYAPATPKMRGYGCTCPDTPDVEETGTYIVYQKCPIHGLR